MNYYPFNSRNSLYKSHIGAVTSGESLMFRLLLHKDAHVNEVFLSIQKDNENLVEYSMTPKDFLEDYRFYEYSLTFDEGIYWYYFRYTSEYGEFFVSKNVSGNGTVSKEKGESFQQTVYSPDFITPSGLRGGIIYQIFPDRFAKSGMPKKNVPFDRVIRNDWGGIPFYEQTDPPRILGNDYFGGDLKGIEEKLPYLKELGVTVIYLNPIFEAHSNHRYNTADYMKIDSLLGDEDDFVSLCDKAHKENIKIILDGVFSHTGDDSVYFDRYGRYGLNGAYICDDSPYKNWYKFGKTKDEYKSWWGVKSLPETDETNEDFSEFICKENGVLRKWIRLGADGWRLDVADELPDVFLEKIRKSVKSEKPDAFIIGEVWEDATNKISYGARRRYLLGNQLDSVMNYPFANGIIEFIREQNAEKLCETVCNICENYPPQTLHLLMNHIGTHDTARILNRLSSESDDYGSRENQAGVSLSEEEKRAAKEKLKAAAVIQYTLPGIPSLFYGDEAGIDGLCDPFCRKCFPWQNADKELINFYKSLGAVRHSLTALESGDFEPFCVEGGFLSYLRKDGKTAVLVAVNVSDKPGTLTLSSGFKQVFGKQDEGNVITLFKNEYMIAEKKVE